MALIATIGRRRLRSVVVGRQSRREPHRPPASQTVYSRPVSSRPFEPSGRPSGPRPPARNHVRRQPASDS